MKRIPAWPRSGSLDPTPLPAGRRDIAVALALALLAAGDIPEGVVRWQPASAIAALIAVTATYWRRRQPLAMLVVAFGVQFAAELASGLTDNQLETAFGHVLALGLLVYALGRWGTWRATIIGVGFTSALSVAGELITAVPNWEQQLIDVLTWGMLLAAGIAMRYRSALQRTRADQIRSEERERIARDLHDVVAHHVSAIALQAEGARAISSTNPKAAVTALETIHATASDTLNEMRKMVAILRDKNEPSELTPGGTISELEDLLDHSSLGIPISFHVSGDLDTLPPRVSTAILRITQEAVTNARRHSTNSQAIKVDIECHERTIELTITDDGDHVSSSGHEGYGILGMTERSALLGGTLTAAPLDDRGWQVHASIPIESQPQ
ncbi:MAG: histidine kinase [Acidimicrobiales bacterium]